MSLAKLLEQNGLISSYKYHWRFESRPVGTIFVGCCPRNELGIISFLNARTSISGEFAYSLTVTIPGSALDILK